MRRSEYQLPYAGGCDLGTRTVEPHMQALREFGLSVEAKSGFYSVQAPPADGYDRSFVLTERGDTVTENAIMAAAHREGVTVIRNASPNYMVQDLCFYLQRPRRGDRGRGHHHPEDHRAVRRSTWISSTSPRKTPSRP